MYVHSGFSELDQLGNLFIGVDLISRLISVNLKVYIDEIKFVALVITLFNTLNVTETRLGTLH